MPTINHLFEHIRTYGLRNKGLYVMSLLVLFFALFDGIVAFISPIIITKGGYSTLLMGLIISSSSIAGIIFDFLLCRIFTNTSFRRLFFILFIICAIFPLILLNAKVLGIYLIAMALWGLYYDLFNFGRFNFVGRFVDKKEHSSGFGVISVFLSVGYLIAPLIAGFLVFNESIDYSVFIILWLFIGIAFIFYLVLIAITKKQAENIKHQISKTRPLLKELHLWRKIGVAIFPLLLLTLILNMIDATFWTIGPLISGQFPELGALGSIFLVAYLLPPLITGWFVGSITKKYSSHKTAYVSLLIGSVLFVILIFITNNFFLLAVTFLASFFISISFPAINGLYADYILDYPVVEKEIEGLQDSATNLGFIIGPAFAGLFATLFGNLGAFAILGIMGAIIALYLLFDLHKTMPKIDLKKNEL